MKKERKMKSKTKVEKIQKFCEKKANMEKHL